MKKILKDKTVLITGGTGSFGKSFAEYLLKNFSLKKLIIFSRDELKQFEMGKEFSDKRLRFFIGDIRDLARLNRAFREVDIVVHAAALKQVPALEYNPYEAVKTNTIGSQNVIEAAIDQKVGKVLLISTDKAAYPGNLYGATKLCAEKLFVSGNSYSSGVTKLSVVRYGNVIGSRGSLIESLLKENGKTVIEVTDPEMTRFWITLQQSFDLVFFALKNMVGGEIFVPKIPSMKLIDIFEAIAPTIKRRITGIRPGEKLHEVLLTDQESRRVYDLKKYYVILPEFPFAFDKEYLKYSKLGKKSQPGFIYASNNNDDWITKENFKKIIKEIITIKNGS